MVSTAMLLTACLAVTTQIEKANDTGATTGKMSGFVVTLIHDVSVSARESGILTTLKAHRGNLVKTGDILGNIDDSAARIRRIIAENELKVAEEQAASDASLKAAKATVGVAEAEYRGTQEIIDQSPNAISKNELRRKKLTHERSVYESLNAEVEHRVALLTRDMRAAQLDAVENEIQRRRIESPIDGIVERRFRDPGEWVQAGEPVYRVVRMGRLRVEGLLSADTYSPKEIENQLILIEVNTPHGIEKIQAKLDFVSRVVDPGGEFLVSAEFDNPRMPDGHWLVRPGLKAEITILKQAKPLAASTSLQVPAAADKSR